MVLKRVSHTAEGKVNRGVGAGHQRQDGGDPPRAVVMRTPVINCVVGLVH